MDRHGKAEKREASPAESDPPCGEAGRTSVRQRGPFSMQPPPGSLSLPRCPHTLRQSAVAEALGVRPVFGLEAKDVQGRRRQFGRNILARHRRKAVWTIVLGQARSFAVVLLMTAALLSLAFGDIAEGAAILVVLAINATIGTYTEWRAVRSMEALHRLSRVSCRVRRDGATVEIDSRDLVPGDIVLLHSGDIVPADLRLVTAAGLQCDESTLTGESVPVPKTLDPLSAKIALADRTNLAFRGTSVTRGRGEGIVVATGMATELGRIAALAHAAEAETSPLERRLDRLTTNLVWLTLALAAGIAAAGVLRGQDLVTMIETAIALAIAAVPEGLPVVATLTLARGMWRMARRNALIERLSAVETLGATTVIFTDKTGTLTENRMSVRRYLLWGTDVDVSRDVGAEATVFRVEGRPVDPDAYRTLTRALEIGVLCAESDRQAGVSQHRPDSSDPMETALLRVGKSAGLAGGLLAQTQPTLLVHAFDPDLKMMATIHRDASRLFAAVKGAPEEVIARSVEVQTPDGMQRLSKGERLEWLERVANAAGGGFRVLALAEKTVSDINADPYSDLTLVGMVCLIDPVRADVPDAVRQCREAGVRVIMLTGDHPATAEAIARQAGLDADGPADIIAAAAADVADPSLLEAEERARLFATNVFSRVSPETKLSLVNLYQRRGEIVAMTGDGVNDAPALKKADIGIAMGRRGTEVAREAAAMVLKDDSFATIVTAMREGRIIFNNIRLFVIYLMSCNVSEILVVGLATVAGMPLPLLPLQVLYLNLVTDVFPAFAVAMGEGNGEVMRSPPRRPSEAIAERRHWIDIAVFGALITSATLAAFTIAQTSLHLSPAGTVTVSFTTIALAQLWNVFNMRGATEGLFSNAVSRNLFVWGALALCLGLIGASIYIPGLSDILGLASLGMDALALAFGASLLPLVGGQLWIGLARRGPSMKACRSESITTERHLK